MKQFTSKTQKTGELGEEAAVVFLMKQGYKILERNIANRYGEIDIVAQKRGTYYFFEVKAGKIGGLFNPAENLTSTKLKKFLISVEHYCYTRMMNGQARNIKEYRVQGIIVLLGPTEPHRVEIIDIS